MGIDSVPTESVDWHDLKSKGYLIIPSFLSEEEMKVFLDDFKAVNNASNHAKYDLVDIREHIIQKFRGNNNVKKCLIEANNAGIHADTVLGGSYFSTFKGQNYHWHQDQVSYYTCQNHYDYLNFYIPIIKPDRAKSNISLIPFDRLQDLDPDWYQKILGKGAIDYYQKRNKTRILENDQTGKIIHTLDFKIDQHAVTPHLNAGDLLIMRGDIVHRTQDSDTKRVSISIRAVNSEHMIEYRKLIKGTFSKLIAMSENRSLFKYMIEVFNTLKKDKVPVKVFLGADLGIQIKTGSYFGFFFKLLLLRFKLSQSVKGFYQESKL